MPHTQWRPSPVSVLRDPTTLLRHFGDHASEDPVRASNLSMGLPTPIWPAKRDLSPSERSQRAAQRQGVQVHAAIGESFGLFGESRFHIVCIHGAIGFDQSADRAHRSSNQPSVK